MPYIATIYGSGFLPDSDTPALRLDTAADAWLWLAEERMQWEDQEAYAGNWSSDTSVDGVLSYSDVALELERRADMTGPDGSSSATQGTVWDGATVYEVTYVVE